MIFVFGSNRSGIHGAGAALWAWQREGAIYGKGEGLAGNSYALPTKDNHIQTLSLPEIQEHVNRFIEFAKEHPELQFKITRVGCGLAGLKDGDMAPMFYDAPKNCFFDYEWHQYLEDMDYPERFQYWGTFE
jgi:hypothetical protein